MYRRLCVAGLVSLALAASVAGCGGGGDTYCSPDDVTCDVTPLPTDTPDSTSGGDSAPSECDVLKDAYLVYPLDASELASYANTMYVEFIETDDAVQPSPYFAIALVFTEPGQTLPLGTEVGTTIQFVSDPPQMVSGFDNLYSSSNLPLQPNRHVIVTLVDTRKPAKCSGVQLATIDTATQSVSRVPAARAVRASARRSAVQTVLRGGRL